MSKTLTRADLVIYLSDEMGLNRLEARRLVDALFNEISEALYAGEDVRLWGFGNFVLRDKPQRPGRNPRNGQEAVIKPRARGDFSTGTEAA